LTVHVDPVGGAIRLVGCLDRVTSHLLADAISTLLLGNRDTWVVDVTRLATCDRIGVRAIGAAYRRAVQNGRQMTLTGATEPLQRQLESLRLDRHLIDSGTTAADALPA